MIHIMKINRIIPCDGSSIWTDTKGLKVKVESIRFEQRGEIGQHMLLFVKHNAGWRIYTDEGFEKGISQIVSKKIGAPVKICFTEQGMQEKHIASMEFRHKTCEENFRKYLRERLK